MSVDELTAHDPEIAALIEAEDRRRHGGLQMLAAETTSTPAVHAAMASVLADKYAEGYPGRRYHGGCEVVDAVEELACARARQLFGAQYANVQPLSWSMANLAVYVAFAQPGDAVLSLSLRHGGHLTHGSRANWSGRWFTPLNYEVRRDTELIDYDQVRELALLHRPRILVAGGTSHTRKPDYAALRAIADEADCILWVDGAHLAGLAAGGVLESPVPYADVVSVATNKVLRGPRGGLLLSRGEHAEALSRAVYPFLQGAAGMHSIGAKAVALRESASEDFHHYAVRVAANAAALATAFADLGLRPVSGGTDTHVVIVEVTSLGISGREARQRLEAVGIVADKAVTPFDERPVREGSAIRLGTAVISGDGMTPGQMPRLAELMVDAMRIPLDAVPHRADVVERIAALAAE